MSQDYEVKSQERKPFIGQKVGEKPRRRFAAYAPAGGGSTARWVRPLERDLPELRSFFAFSRHL